MGKAGKWFRSIFMGKKDNEERRSHVSCYSAASESPGTPLSETQKEKRRWSFRRSSAKAVPHNDQITFEAVNEQKRHALAVAAAAAAAAVICLTSSTNSKASVVQEAAAIRIQSYFRSYLAKKAMCALRGLVKLQALVRGHLVRKQAFATLRCMQALITAQDRARALRIQMAEDHKSRNQRPPAQRKSTQDNQSRPGYPEIERSMEENIKIVEMDIGEPSRSFQSRNNHSNQWQTEEANHRFSMQIPACIGDFGGSSFGTAQTSPPQYSAVSKPGHWRVPFAFTRSEYGESVSYDDPMFPNYMANTDSWRAKVRSQSAPRSRPDSLERQPSRRKQSTDGRNVRMQRSASQISPAAQNYQYICAIKLDKSTVSCKDSLCGSTYSVLTTSNYHRSPVANEITEIIHFK